MSRFLAGPLDVPLPVTLPCPFICPSLENMAGPVLQTSQPLILIQEHVSPVEWLPADALLLQVQEFFLHRWGTRASLRGSGHLVWPHRGFLSVEASPCASQ